MAGGRHGSPYHLLYLIAAILPPAVHPPKRAAALIATGLLALAAPLAYEPATSLLVSEIVLQGSFTMVLAFFTWAIVGAAQMRLELEAETRFDDLTGLGNPARVRRGVEGRAGPPQAPRERAQSDRARPGWVQGRQRPPGTLGRRPCSGALGRGAAARGSHSGRLFSLGGDEFAVLLVESDIEAAREIGRRVQATVAEHCSLEDGSTLSVRFGAAELEVGQDAGNLVAAADAALLDAKRTLVG